MKSINEFSVEYAQDKYLPVQTSQAVKAGANYVLKEIGRIVNSAIENNSMTIPTWRLNYIIKQLKK